MAQRPRILAPRLALALFAALAGPLLSQAAAQSHSVETTATTVEGAASLTVRVFGETGELKGAFGGARVYVNRAYVGTAPWSAATMAPGTYLMGVEADGYRPQEFAIVLQEKTSYVVTMVLERRTGFLSTRVEPADAEVLIDGKSARPGLVELPTGAHELRVRRFAFVEECFTVHVAE